MAMHPSDIRIGQIWEQKGRRTPGGRQIKITSVQPELGKIDAVSLRHVAGGHHDVRLHQATLLKGWKLVQDNPHGAVVESNATLTEACLTGTCPSPVPVDWALAWNDLLFAFRQHIQDMARKYPGPLFRTNAVGFFEAWLKNLPAHSRQQHHCHACRDFLGSWGGLVAVAEDGKLVPVLFDGFRSGPYADAFEQMEVLVKASKIVGPFFSYLPTWGHPRSRGGRWTHLAVQHVPEAWRTPMESTKTFEQREAEAVQDRKVLRAALVKIDVAHVNTALGFLTTPSYGFIRPEHGVEWLQWIKSCLEILRNFPRPEAENLIWVKARKAPASCHIPSSVVGRMLDNIREGKGIIEVRHAWNEMLDPTQYQRPQAAPKEGQVQRAESLVAMLGVERSFERRVARVEEVQTIWKPGGAPASERPRTGLFADLHTRRTAPMRMLAWSQPSRSTWAKFERDVMPDAREIWVTVPATGRYYGITAPVHADAPPIFLWDKPDRRNPFSWYTYSDLANLLSPRWSLSPGREVRVTGVCRFPFQWYGMASLPIPKGVVLLLEGCRNVEQPGMCLFPEALRKDLHEIRSTIEAYSSTHSMYMQGGTASGIALNDGPTGVHETQVRVVGSSGFETKWLLDRWE